MIKVEVEVDLIFNADVKKSSVAFFAFEDDVVTACASPEHVLCITWLSCFFQYQKFAYFIIFAA